MAYSAFMQTSFTTAKILPL